jgi:hypothetical protein
MRADHARFVEGMTALGRVWALPTSAGQSSVNANGAPPRARTRAYWYENSESLIAVRPPNRYITPVCRDLVYSVSAAGSL